MTINANIFQLIGMLRKSKNPQEFVINMIQNQAGDNPIFANLLDLARQGKSKEIETVARNMCQERGLDFDKEFNSFRHNLGL